jgi:predicted metal-binding protein
MVCRVTICEGCRTEGGPAKGAAMAEALRGLVPGGVEVALTDCMIVCGAPVTVSVRAEGKAAYLFSGVQPDVQVAEVATFVGLYLAAEGGIVEDVRPCGDLRFRLVGRIPA